VVVRSTLDAMAFVGHGPSGHKRNKRNESLHGVRPKSEIKQWADARSRAWCRLET
jgi:hypothetical protein